MTSTSKAMMALSAAVMLSTAACKKKTSTPDPTSSTTTTTGGASAFSWQENSGATINADSAFWSSGSWGTGVRAFKNGYANYFEINWSTPNDASTGTKSLSAGSFTFLKGAATYTNPAAQTLTVSALANNKMSGNFNVAVTGGSISSLQGTFSAIPKK